METRVAFLEDPAAVLSMAGEFLASEPVLHNLILSLLHGRVTYSEPGRYWVASQNNRVVGVVFQSPVTFPATLTPMGRDAIASLAGAIADAGVALPGVIGDAATAASFAGHWTERSKSAATPFQGMRLYELTELREVSAVDGALRQAVIDERSLMLAWVRAFRAEIGEKAGDPEPLVDRWLAGGRLWLWDNGQPASMAVGREPVEGVIRITEVYTPPENRRRGYAAACVHGLSKWIRDGGYRCILYADLNNPTSNSIYRGMGYRAVGEAIRYRFE